MSRIAIFFLLLVAPALSLILALLGLETLDQNLPGWALLLLVIVGTGFLLAASGVAVGYGSLLGMIAVPLLLFPGLAYRIRIEENLLREHFGEEFQTYARRVKKLIPGIR
jgi:protein-S-isoprenylcysteine O-methyltransferase Ste14